MFSWIVNILFPIRCIHCKSDVGMWLCEHCQQKIIYAPKKESYTDYSLPVYTLFRSNSVINSCLYALKYKWHAEIARIFGGSLVAFLQNFPLDTIVLVAVPISRKRYLERGYNQVHTILQSHPLLQKIPQLRIYRVKHTITQTKLSKEARKKNVADIFACLQMLDPNFHYIICDDVVTTGATTHEIAQTLIKSGARNISILALTRGTFHPK